MKIITFILLNFIVAMISDIILHDLTRKPYYTYSPKIIQTLKPYFANKSIIQSSIYAGITIIVAVIINIFISYSIFGFTLPNTLFNLIQFLLLAFFIGYIIDNLIYKWKIFGSTLDSYYETAGAGFWGALSLIFSILISLIIQKTIIPLL